MFGRLRIPAGCSSSSRCGIQKCVLAFRLNSNTGTDVLTVFQVHNMGDAGYILFGPFGRELLAFGTVSISMSMITKQYQDVC